VKIVATAYPMQHWKIGDVRVTKLVEIEMTSRGTWILPDATPENLAGETWLQPHFANDEGKIVMSIHSLLVESQGRRILVDTCVGNDKERNIPNWSRRQGPYLDDLEEAGFAPDSIDAVLCTHLHIDHVGWNTRLEDGRWVPSFPGARYLFSRTEYDWWVAHDDEAFGPVIQDSVKPVFDAGLVDLVESDHLLTDEVRLESTPGHTPGHVSVHIASRGEEAVITGDLMHHPVQCAHPDWGSSADVDPDAALRTRRDFLKRYADRPVLVLGTHFATPTAGHIVRDGETWRLAV
jgi:glyoxylase-like metal-dependent hydrolase (beta-lactamase superfamily II)